MTSVENRQSVTELIATLALYRRRQVMKLALIRGLWVGLILLLLLFYMDTVTPLRASQRLLFDGVVGAMALCVGLLTYLSHNLSQSKKRMLARLVENRHPELKNDLINALEFEEQLSHNRTGAASIGLMKLGIEWARESLSSFEDLEDLKPPSLRSESRCLGAITVAWIACALCLHTWFGSQIMRFVHPSGDHPPFSLTRLAVMPEGAVVDYGKDLTINVTATGELPEEVWLVVKDPQSGVENQVSMFSGGDPNLFHQTIEDIRSDMVYCARIEGSRSKYYPISLSNIPRIEMVEALYRYPTYSRLAERSTVLNPQDSELKGYKGTEVTLSIQSNRPLGGGVLRAGEETYACKPVSEHMVQVVFPLSASEPFTVSVTDTQGNVSTDPFAGTITLVPDGRPAVAIVSPGMQALAIPTAQIPIVVKAQDDLGIQGVSLFCSHNESDDTHCDLYDVNETQTYVQVVQTLDLADLGVYPGDTINYYATATDAWPTAPQTVASEPYTIQIISEEEYTAMQQQEMTAKDLRHKYETILGQIDALIKDQQDLHDQIESLEQQLETAADPNAAAAVREQLATLADQQDQLTHKTEEMAAKLQSESETPPVFDIEEDYKKALAQIADQARKAAEHMAQSASSMKEGAKTPGQSSSAMAQAGQSQEKALEELGEQTQAMRDTVRQANNEIEQLMQIMADVEIFKQIYMAQKHLARQVKSFSDTEAHDFDSKIRLKEMAERQAAIKDTLELLVRDLPIHGEAIKQDYPKVTADAQKIADEITERKIPEIMAAGASFLNQGDGIQAYPQVNEALKQLEAMISLCESAGGSACKQCEFRLQIKMMLNPGSTMNQLSKGLNPGMGMGMGTVGALGRGSSGFGGGQSQIAMFGNDTFGKNQMTDSLMAASSGSREDMEAGSLPDVPNPLAGNVEALTPQAKRDMEIEMKGQNRTMTEYRPLIEAYFRRLAEE
jgi:hypothetical protein